VTTPRQLTKRKSNWKTRVKALLNIAKLRYALIRSGADEDMAECYDVCQRIATLGRLGERLLSEVRALGMQDRTVLDVEWHLLSLSRVSGKFYDLAAQLHWPLRSLATYTVPAQVRGHFPEEPPFDQEED
jgi:hypothetical protein